VATFISGCIPRNQNPKQDGARFFIFPPDISFINHHLFTKVSIQLITVVPELVLPNGKMMLILKFWAFCFEGLQRFSSSKRWRWMG
jgi:hypothetical protein